MKLAHLLFKPKWQDKNPQLRRSAVATGNEPELVAALADLARNDADSGVRLAALKRLDNYEAWRERSTGDAEPELRRTARQAYLALLCVDDARVPSLPRRIAELDTLATDEIEKVASHAINRDLRAAALASTTRPAFLAERAVADPDAGIRLGMLQRIDDVAMLDRIAERVRKTDKAVNRRARELAEQRRIGSGDTVAVAQRARMLCERMESLLRAPVADLAIEHAAIEREWHQLVQHVAADVMSRYRGAEALVQQMQVRATTPQKYVQAPTSADFASPTQEILARISDTIAPALLSVDMLASQARFNAALAEAAAESQREREKRHQYLREIEDFAVPYAAALERGDTAAAHRLHACIENTRKFVDSMPAQLEARLAPLEVRYVELKNWQHWANQQRRQSLCDDLEKLEAGLHPDALATRIREARAEWQRLDVSEGIIDRNDSGIARRFHTLCQRALKPTKAYFGRRDELRRSYSGEIEQLLRTAETLPAEIQDWKALAALRVKLGESLRTLDAVDPRERTGLARRIKTAIGSIAPRLAGHEQSIETNKQRLIERAAALTSQTDQRSAVREVRELQQQWTALGNGRRAIDQRQWNEFRRACDAVFEKLDSARKQRDGELETSRARALELLDELDALSNADALAAADVKTKARDLDTRWQTLQHADRAFEQRYRKLRETIAARQQDNARRQRLSRYTEATQRYALLRALEIGAHDNTAIAPQWDAATHVAGELREELEARRARAAGFAPTASTAENVARDRLVELEFLAGIETPPEDRERRMQYQLQRLAARMRDGARLTPEIELQRALAAWFAQSPQTNELESRFANAAETMIASLP